MAPESTGPTSLTDALGAGAGFSPTSLSSKLAVDPSPEEVDERGDPRHESVVPMVAKQKDCEASRSSTPLR